MDFQKENHSHQHEAEQTTENQTSDNNATGNVTTELGHHQSYAGTRMNGGSPDFANLCNNRVFISGKIASEPVFSHEVFGEGFYEMNLSVDRLSSMQDIIPITLSERLLANQKIVIGASIAVKGQFRSYNKLVGERSKLMLTVFVREVIGEQTIDGLLTIDNPNVIEITGYVCKAPIYRTTPFNREICDILLAVNRAYNKSDYIPAIAWGRNARFAKNMLVGEKVFLTGRIQSREYQKRLEDGSTETRVAFEVSVNKISRDALESQFSDTDTAFITENTEQVDALV